MRDKPRNGRGFAVMACQKLKFMTLRGGSLALDITVYDFVPEKACHGRRFSRCEIDSHSSRSASTFSRNMNALCEVIFRPISPRATPLLRGHHLIIASRGLAELPGRRV